MIPIVNTDWLGAFTIKTVSNAKAIIQAVILSFKFFIVVLGFNYFYKYKTKNPHSEGFHKKYFLKLSSWKFSCFSSNRFCNIIHVSIHFIIHHTFVTFWFICFNKVQNFLSLFLFTLFH